MKHNAPQYSLPLPDAAEVPPDESKRVTDDAAHSCGHSSVPTDLHHCLSVLGKCRGIFESKNLLNQSAVLAEAQNKIMDVLKKIEQ